MYSSICGICPYSEKSQILEHSTFQIFWLGMLNLYYFFINNLKEFLKDLPSASIKLYIRKKWDQSCTGQRPIVFLSILKVASLDMAFCVLIVSPRWVTLW
jgi:hypothetical protein